MFHKFWNRSEFVILKPILIRWGILYLISTFFIAGWLIQITFLSHQKTLSSQNPTIKLATRFETVYPKKTTYNKTVAKKPAEARLIHAVASLSVPGNTYAPGNCTWYAKSKRPDLPNNLGNANTWASRARAQGFNTGNTPELGAIGQRQMHVVYVEKVNEDNTVLISEMNYVGLGKISNRTLPADLFSYIY